MQRLALGLFPMPWSPNAFCRECTKMLQEGCGTRLSACQCTAVPRHNTALAGLLFSRQTFCRPGSEAQEEMVEGMQARELQLLERMLQPPGLHCPPACCCKADQGFCTWLLYHLHAVKPMSSPRPCLYVKQILLTCNS